MPWCIRQPGIGISHRLTALIPIINGSVGCFASDITFDGEGVTWPLAHEFPYSTIENTYYEANVESGDAAKTAEQFASGEVCSLLNKGVTDGSQIWYQNIAGKTSPDRTKVSTDESTVFHYFTINRIFLLRHGFNHSTFHRTIFNDSIIVSTDNPLTSMLTTIAFI